MKSIILPIRFIWIVIMTILILPHAGQAQTCSGNVLCIVKNCYNNAPIAGATVSCSNGSVTTTNATGTGFFSNLPCMVSTFTASCFGFISQAQNANVVNGTITIEFCLPPVAAYVTGTVTNCVTGQPLGNVHVTDSQVPADPGCYSDNTGVYSLFVYPGGLNQHILFRKVGFRDTTIIIGSLIPPATVIRNIQLKPVIENPSNVVAALNGTQTAAVISWSPTGQLVEMSHDDGVPEQCTQSMIAGLINAVKFVPCGYPAEVISCNVNLCYPSSPASPVNLYVLKDDGAGGSPGTILAGPFPVTSVTNGWNGFTLPAPLMISSGNFYIGVEETGVYPDITGVQADTTTNQMMSWQKSGAGPWVPAGSNFLIRANVNEPCGNFPPSDITYQVWRLKAEQEITPAVWTGIGSVNGLTTITDPSWNTLQAGPYRWAVKAVFPCNGSTSSTLSNILGKNWTANVTLHGSKCCDSLPKEGMYLKAFNLDYPDTIYYGITDANGNIQIPAMWKGHYKITGRNFGCISDSLLVNVANDTVVNIALYKGIATPPNSLSVQATTLVATWNKPAFYSVPLISENWSSGNLNANGWTVSGGTNWMISTGIGNIGPSAMFNWTPQVLNYDQYLTSRVIAGQNSLALKLKYDIYLDDFGTSTMNSMAVEIWDGTSWNVLKTYDNQGGSIPWTTEVLNIQSYTDKNFRIRFHAYGENSADLNNWNIDNISVDASAEVACMIGYNVYLNNAFGAFIPDTVHYIAPSQVYYGESCQLCVVAVYDFHTPAYSSHVCTNFVAKYLAPPQNFNADSVECSAYLTWEKPVPMTGTNIPVLLGYNVYRDYAIVHFVNDPDSLYWYDMELLPGSYEYMCTAKYDISPCGFPGQTDESLSPGNDVVHIACGMLLPYLESWNWGNFNAGGWTFEPSQGNWKISGTDGDPAPSADFGWTGKAMNLDYNYSMVSPPINASMWNCAHLYLGFDIKLSDRFAASTEKMTVEIYYDNTWHPLSEFVNNGSFDWESKIYNIDQVRGKGMKIRFRANGSNSYNILHWYLDNIKVYGECLPPAGLDWAATQTHVELNWTEPCPTVSGYNIYRSDSLGNSPFTKINATPVTGTTYTDVPPGWSMADQYRYYVTAQQTDVTYGSVFCESAASDTILAGFPTGVSGISGIRVSLYPNPAGNTLNIRSNIRVSEVSLMSSQGVVVLQSTFKDDREIRLNTSALTPGIYFVRISTSLGIVFRKVVIRK